jgi:hypothetical protein
MSTQAEAQATSTTAGHKSDTAHVEKISIADLEMIDPENRLIPESKEVVASEESAIVESPFSSATQKTPQPQGKITATDLEMLEQITPAAQASEGRSR